MEFHERLAKEILVRAVEDRDLVVHETMIPWQKAKRKRLILEANQFLSGGEDLEFWCKVAGLSTECVQKKFGN